MHPAGPNPKPGYSAGFFKVATQQSPKPQTVAIVTADGEATRLVTDGVYENAKAAGLQIVHDRRYPLNTTRLLADRARRAGGQPGYLLHQLLSRGFRRRAALGERSRIQAE